MLLPERRPFLLCAPVRKVFIKMWQLACQDPNGLIMTELPREYRVLSQLKERPAARAAKVKQKAHNFAGLSGWGRSLSSHRDRLEYGAGSSCLKIDMQEDLWQTSPVKRETPALPRAALIKPRGLQTPCSGGILCKQL
jgi:hypothetical protein